MKYSAELLVCVQLIFHSTLVCVDSRWKAASISPPGTYTSYQLGPVCKPNGPIRTPRNVHEVLELVNFAKRSNSRIKAFGHRHSMTDIICTEGIAVDMSLIKGMLLNPDNTVTVGAGVTLLEVSEFLHRHKRSLGIIPAYGDVTIGGALGTGSHGSSLKHESSLSEQTIAVKIIDGTGAVRQIQSAEEMRAYRNHLGLLGIIMEATLVTVPDYKIAVHNYEASDEILSNGLWEAMARSSDSFLLYWFPPTKTVVISNGTFVRVESPGNAWTNDHVPPTLQIFNAAVIPTVEAFQNLNSFSGLNILERVMQKTLTTLVPAFAPIYTEDGIFVKNPAIGYSYKMLAANCNANCAWLHYPFNLSMIDNEISLDTRDMSQFVATIRDILSISPATFPLQGILMRFSKKTDTILSTSNGRDTVHLEWYPIKRKNQFEDPISGMEAYQVMMQALTFTYGGRSHWGKSGLYYHSRKVLQRKFDSSNLEKFKAIRKRADPYQIFMNNFGERLLNISDKIDLDPRTKHCAILDNCICRFHKDCAPGQFCGSFREYPNFPVCNNNPSKSVLP